jgi:O-acetyl-ADP-ribose deacetylase (regulator of RNase III)
MKTYLAGRLGVTHGDITVYEGDAIVNAANSSLYGGGGVDGAIHRAGGPAILNECRLIRKNLWPDGLPTGEAVITGPGNLRCRHVIHTVGPVWHGGDQGEPELLARAYRSCLNLAAGEKQETLAFPAISTGVYGFPKEKAAAIVFETIRVFLQSHPLPRRVDLIFFSPKDEDLFIRTVETEPDKEG